MAQRTRAGWAILALGLAFIAGATLMPEPPSPISYGFHRCVFCGEFGGQDFTLNVVLFVPAGLGAGLIGWRPQWSALGALALSTTIEMLQLLVITGRSSTLGDIVSNTLGGVLGALVALYWREILAPDRSLARALSLLAAVVWLAALALGAWGSQISLPRTVYWTQWQPDLGQFDRYTGRVLDGRLGGTPLPPPFSGGSAVTMQRLTSGPIALAATATPGSPTERVAPILSVFDQHQVEVLVLGQQGRRLVFRVRSRAADLKLRPSSIALDGFFAERPDTTGDTLRVLAEHTGRALRLSSGRVRGEGPRVREQRFSPLLVWSFFVPFDHPLGALTDVLSALTALLLALPLAFWGRRASARATPAAVAIVAVVAIGLGVLPVVFGLDPCPWWQWAAACAGATLGWVVARRPSAR